MRKTLSIIVAVCLCLVISTPSYAQSARAIFQGVIGSGASGGACTASYGSELNTTQTATAPADITEANATTGWTNSGCSTFDASGTAYDGSYALNLVADSNIDYAQYMFTGLGLNASTIYRMRAYVRHNATGGNWLCGFGNGSGTYNIAAWAVTASDTTYSPQTIYFLYNAYERSWGCIENSATNDGGVYIDSLSVKPATLCLGEELYTTSNAISLSGEADATLGIAAINSLNSLSSVSSNTPGDGSYHILADATTNPIANNGFNVDLSSTLTNGQKYFVRFKAKHTGSGDTWKCGYNSSATGAALTGTVSIPNSQTTYVEYGWDITYSSSYRYLVCTEVGANNNGGVYFDSLSIKRITGE